MGWIGAAGSMGRIIFPTLSGVLGHNVSFIVSAAVSFLCAITIALYQKKINSLKRPVLPQHIQLK
jgi:hypothetical protein